MSILQIGLPGFALVGLNPKQSPPSTQVTFHSVAPTRNFLPEEAQYGNDDKRPTPNDTTHSTSTSTTTSRTKWRQNQLRRVIDAPDPIRNSTVMVVIMMVMAQKESQSS